MTEMSPAEEVFFAALEKDPADRSAYLDAACAGRPELRARVDKLLAAHPKVGGFLEPPGTAGVPPATVTAAPAPDPDPDPTASHRPAGAAPGAVVAGRYKLLQQIGEGGMGTVWMADQTEPVKRRVAVKLVRADRGQSRTILARFEAERQAIALMDHPHIAKLLDAGTTDAGEPFFVMDLVKGVPLTDFCDAHKLPVPDRLALFVQVCGAVQHAHQKGVIHRDLKPSNVLVESHDGKPVPKVIDFGLAKAAGPKLTDHTLFTAFGSVMGTPLYMAPEQAAFNAVDVDTRADVYALGVILYELLTGTTPLARDTLKKAALDELLRLIREQEAPTPSSRLSGADSQPTVAANRQTEPAKLGRLVKGELDWIVLKALSKERDRRYESATGFARDVERFLNHEPVAAGPPGAGYRVRKFVRRNRGPVAAALLLGLALVVGAAGTTWGMVRATRAAEAEQHAREDAQAERAIALQAAEAERAARQAEADQRRAAEAATEQAKKRLTQIEEGNAVLTAVFDDLNIGKVRGGTEPLEAVLAKRLVTAAGQLEGEAVGDPLVVAALQQKLGAALLSLGHPREAVPLFEKSRATLLAARGPGHPDILAGTNKLATAYLAAGQIDRALRLLEELLAVGKGTGGGISREVLPALDNLARTYLAAGQLGRAVRLWEEALAVAKATLGPDHPLTVQITNNLANGYLSNKRPDLALPLLEQGFAALKARNGPDHPNTLTGMNNLANAYLDAGQTDRAVPMLEELLRRRRARLGADHPKTIGSMNDLAGGYRRAGRPDRAVPLWEEALDRCKARLGPDHPDTLQSLNNLAIGHLITGHADQAVPLFEEAARLRKAKLGPDHPDTVNTLLSLETAYVETNQGAKAAAALAEVVAVLRGRAPKADPLFAGLLARLAAYHVDHGQDAEAVLRECLAIRERAQPDAWTTSNTRSMLGGSLLGQGKHAEAEPLLVAGYEGMKQREKTIPPQGRGRLPEAADRLVELYERLGKPDEVRRWRAERANYPFVAPPPRPAR